MENGSKGLMISPQFFGEGLSPHIPHTGRICLKGRAFSFTGYSVYFGIIVILKFCDLKFSKQHMNIHVQEEL